LTPSFSPAASAKIVQRFGPRHGGIWPYDDPTNVQGTAEQVEAAYFRVASRIRYRLQLFNNLSLDQLDRLRIEVKMKNLAKSE
jgi:hypothetical protein